MICLLHAIVARLTTTLYFLDEVLDNLKRYHKTEAKELADFVQKQFSIRHSAHD
jgi:hypothetical protein